MTWNGKKFKSSIEVCKDCVDREIGCHATCEKYITAKKEWEETKRLIYEERCKIIEYDTFRFDTVSKRKAKRDRKARMLHKSK